MIESVLRRAGTRTSTQDHFEALAIFDLESRMRWYDDKSELAGRNIQEPDLFNNRDGSRVRNAEENLLV